MSLVWLFAAVALLGVVSTAAAYQSGFYADNGLQQTMMVDAVPIREQRHIKQEILTLLTLHHRPKPRSAAEEGHSAPTYMLDLYRSMQMTPHHPPANSTDDEQRQLADADMIMGFGNKAAAGHQIRHSGSRRLYFDFTRIPATETLRQATLHVYKTDRTARRTSAGDRFTLQMYRLRQGDDREDRILELESSVSVTSAQHGWLTINVTTAAGLWTSSPYSNLGLLMMVKDGKGRDLKPSDLGFLKVNDVGHKQPFLIGYFKSSARLRSRKTRSTRSTRRNEYNDESGYWWSYPADRHSRACQKRTLYVSFRELGWADWIIAPIGYAAYYCHGECSFPLNAHMNATNHAIVQTLVHLLDPYMVPKPCCAPTRLSAISVLYYDDNSNVILKKYRNMVVQACGCH